MDTEPRLLNPAYLPGCFQGGRAKRPGRKVGGWDQGESRSRRRGSRKEGGL